jgi:hypothetical protein
MNEQLRQRILRRLEALSDERGYQILDYVEFLESKYAERSAPGGLFTTLAEGLEDTMRAAKLPIRAISGTTGLVDSAARLMKGVAAAAGSVVDEAVKAAAAPSPRPAAPPPPAAEPPPATPAP